MSDLSKEQKIEIIANIRKGIIPSKILHIINSPIVISFNRKCKLDNIEFTEQEYQSSMKTLATLERTILNLESENLIHDLLKE